MSEGIGSVTNDLACFLSRESRKPRNDIVVVHLIELDARPCPQRRRCDASPRPTGKFPVDFSVLVGSLSDVLTVGWVTSNACRSLRVLNAFA